jgi:hypothetical protein
MGGGGETPENLRSASEEIAHLLKNQILLIHKHPKLFSSWFFYN